MPLNPGKPSVDELTQAWRRATDTEIRGALQDLEVFDAEVIAIIQAEAGFRGIKIEQEALIPTISLGRRVRSLLIDHLTSRSPLISFIAGVAYVAVPRILAPYLAGISSGLWYVRYEALYAPATGGLGIPPPRGALTVCTYCRRSS